MLIYQPQCDPYNGIFRILSFLYFDEKKKFNIDLLKILDFYYLFPQFIVDIELPKNLVSYRSKFKKYNNSYAVQGTQKELFNNLGIYQDISINTLVAKRILDVNCYKNNEIFLAENFDIAPYLYQQIELRNEENKELLDFLVNKLSNIDFLGDRGLKARTKLMEYRYDEISV